MGSRGRTTGVRQLLGGRSPENDFLTLVGSASETAFGPVSTLALGSTSHEGEGEACIGSAALTCLLYLHGAGQ